MELESKPLVEHLEELRGRLIVSLVALAAASVIAYGFVDEILKWLLEPAGSVIFVKPMEALVTRLKVAVFSGLFLVLPVILFQFWKFVLPALYAREVRFIKWLITGSYVLFVCGVLFAYYGVFPNALRFLLSFARETIEPRLTFGNYVSFVINFLLAFGAVFQLPLAVLFLTKTGMVEPDYFVRKRKIAVVIIFAGAAVLTPPDIFSQLMIALPAILLYEVSLLCTRWLSFGKNT